MGFWPFGGEKVDSVSRVVTAELADGRSVRGKLTIHFASPRSKSDADAAGDRVAAIAEGMLRERREAEKAVGEEAKINEELVARYPRGIGEARNVELAALHVVGDRSLTDEIRRRSSTSMRAVKIEGAPAATPTPPPTRASSPSSPGMPAQRRRSSSSSMRAIQSLVLPPGSPPSALAMYIAPLVRETAQRVLIGGLRAHDLIAIRKVQLDENTAEALAVELRAIEASPEGASVGRAGEIARWQTQLGEEPIRTLRATANSAAAHAAAREMRAAKVEDATVDQVLEGLVKTAFTHDPPDEIEILRYEDVALDDFAAEVAARMIEVLEGHDGPDGLRLALAPIFTLAKEDLMVAAMIVKQATTPPAPRPGSASDLAPEMTAKKLSSKPPPPEAKKTSSIPPPLEAKTTSSKPPPAEMTEPKSEEPAAAAKADE